MKKSKNIVKKQYVYQLFVGYLYRLLSTNCPQEVADLDCALQELLECAGDDRQRTEYLEEDLFRMMNHAISMNNVREIQRVNKAAKSLKDSLDAHTEDERQVTAVCEACHTKQYDNESKGWGYSTDEVDLCPDCVAACTKEGISNAD